MLHLTGITPALGATARAAVHAAAETARAAGVPVSLDVNYRAALWPPERAVAELRDLARGCELLFAGEDEAELLVGDRGGPAGPDRPRMGMRCGAFAVTVAGDWEGLPTREELDLLRHGDGTVLR